MKNVAEQKSRKGLKITLAILAVVLIAAASVLLWQRKNIESIYIGVTQTSEQIARSRNDNQTELISDVNSYMDGEVRELTDEESSKIENGELSLEEVYAEIFEQKNQEIKNENKKVSKDEIISKYMSALYRLQSEYTAKAEVTIHQGAAYYEKQKKTMVAAKAKQATISHFTPIVRSIERECDGKVNDIIKKLVSELEAIGEKTDISETIMATYHNEKQLKLSYYANKYLK